MQVQSEEVERMEMTIRHLETDLEVQLTKVDELEANNDRLRQELEQHISLIQKQIAK